MYDARRAAGFSRERVAAMLKPPVSTRTIERWEDANEIKRNRLVRLRQLAKLYDVDVSTLADNGGRE